MAGDSDTLRHAARFGDFQLDLRSAELRRRDGAPMRLPEQPFRILLALIEHANEVVLREELREKLWPNNTIVEFEHSINAAVNRLRQVLGDSADRPRFIQTLTRRGYRWMVPVEWVERPRVPPATAPSTATPIGRRVSHYRLLEVLGGGGMGIIYKAEDLQLGRSVALKFLGEEFSGDRLAIERLKREARSLSALDHPNICTIFEVGEDENRPFLAMQLLQGQTLRQRIESAPGSSAFALSELLDVSIAILHGLDAAHEKGIVHRDVKPANIFLTTRGEVKLLDFGLARPFQDAEIAPEQSDATPYSATGAHSINLTLTGVTMGTASYMAPEQVRRARVDARSDLFSFGVVLYEMATGRQPFRGPTLETIHQAILTNTPQSPCALNSALPPQLDTLLARALQKEPERRFQSARELISQLEAVRCAVTGPPPAAVTTPARIAGRNRRVLGAAILMAALLVTASTFLRSRTPRYAEVQTEHISVEKLTDTGRVENVAISRDGHYLAYTQREADGVGLWSRRLADDRETLLVPSPQSMGYRGMTFSPRGDLIYFVRLDAGDSSLRYLYAVPSLGGLPHQLVRDIDSPVAFSPDGGRFVYTRGVPATKSTEVRTVDADGGNNSLLATVPDPYPDYQPGPSWSPDGHTIVVPVMHFRGQPRFALLRVDALSGAIAELIPSPYPIGRALWMPDGETMLLTLEDRESRGQLWSISYPRIESHRVSKDLADYDLRADITADARMLVTLAHQANANLWLTSSAHEWEGHELTDLSLPLRDVIEGSDDALLVQGAGRVWRLSADGRQREAFAALEDADALVRCGPFVLVKSERTNGTELALFDVDGARRATVAAGDLYVPACSPDGHEVYYLDIVPTAEIWRAPVEGGEPESLGSVLGSAIASRISVSADGKTFAYAYSEFEPTPRTRFALFPAEGGPPRQVIELPGAVEHGAAGSPLLAPDAKSVDYVITDHGVSNVWEQSLDGGGHRQLTRFNSGRIFDFNWSRDGKTLLLTRGDSSSDAVLITGLQSAS